MYYLLDLIKNIIIFIGCIVCFHFLFNYFKDFFKKENTNLETTKIHKYKNILNEIKNSLHTHKNEPPLLEEEIIKNELYEFMKTIENEPIIPHTTTATTTTL
jgi:hypothetical protein